MQPLLLISGVFYHIIKSLKLCLAVRQGKEVKVLNFRDDFDWEGKCQQYNNKWELNFPAVYKDVLRTTDIGGVKNVVYRPVKYDDYDWAYSDDDIFEGGLYLFAK
jgi:hypothetical protein